MKECDLLKFDQFILNDIFHSTKYMTFVARGGESVPYSEKIKEYTQTRLMALLWVHYNPGKQQKKHRKNCEWFTIVRILIGVSNITSLQDCFCNCPTSAKCPNGKHL